MAVNHYFMCSRDASHTHTLTTYLGKGGGVGKGEGGERNTLMLVEAILEVAIQLC